MQPTQQLRDIIAAYRTTYTRRSLNHRAPTRAERDVLDLCKIAEGMADAMDAAHKYGHPGTQADVRARLADICAEYVTPSVVFGPIKTEDNR